jgi:hypothetical protein
MMRAIRLTSMFPPLGTRAGVLPSRFIRQFDERRQGDGARGLDRGLFDLEEEEDGDCAASVPQHGPARRDDVAYAAAQIFEAGGGAGAGVAVDEAGGHAACHGRIRAARIMA